MLESLKLSTNQAGQDYFAFPTLDFMTFVFFYGPAKTTVAISYSVQNQAPKKYSTVAVLGANQCIFGKRHNISICTYDNYPLEQSPYASSKRP